MEQNHIYLHNEKIVGSSIAKFLFDKNPEYYVNFDILRNDDIFVVNEKKIGPLLSIILYFTNDKVIFNDYNIFSKYEIKYGTYKAMEIISTDYINKKYHTKNYSNNNKRKSPSNWHIDDSDDDLDKNCQTPVINNYQQRIDIFLLNKKNNPKVYNQNCRYIK